MKGTTVIGAVISLLLASSLTRQASADVAVATGKDASLELGARAQMLGVGQYLDDSARSDARVYLFLKQARLRLKGDFSDVVLRAELAFGGEGTVAAPSPGVALNLLDMSLEIPLGFARSWLRVGQFKVPYGREQLTYSANTLFVERSLQSLGSGLGRDTGMALTVRPGPMSITLGVFAGGGIDVPIRLIPQRLGIPLLVVRAAYGDLDEDPYELTQLPRRDGLRKAVSVSGLYTKDSLIGHSTVMNFRLGQKPLLLNANWNPYIAQSPLVKGELWQMGADGAVSVPMGALAARVEAEVNWGGFSNEYGAVHLANGRLQAGAGAEHLVAAVRYAVLLPDAQFRNSGKEITGKAPIHEITPSITLLPGAHLKLVADLPITLGAPVFHEPNVGSYVGTELPDQAALLKTGTVARQTVIIGRLMLQGQL